MDKAIFPVLQLLPNKDKSLSPLPDRMNNPFYYHPHPLASEAVRHVQTELEEQKEWGREISAGKMFGVLVVRTRDGVIGFLKAFSGQLQGTFLHEGWVPPVYDYLSDDGFFRKEERTISDINERIALLSEDKSVGEKKRQLQSMESESAKAIADMRWLIAEKKKERDRLRNELGCTTPEMIRESQYMKASLKRLVAEEEKRLKPLRDALRDHCQQIEVLRGERKRRSVALQKKLFDHFVVCNGNGTKATLSEIFEKTPQGVPPSGSGECCAPKLLNYALMHEMQPLALAEFWWGESPIGLIRHHLSYYPACSGKCKPILDFMLQGVAVEENALLAASCDKDVKVVYEDSWIVLVDKPSGVLSAPGKGEAPCVIDLLLRKRPDFAELHNVNRLDMQTSGLLMLARNKDAQAELRKLFEGRSVEKTYEAVLDGEFHGPMRGIISLPLAPDYIHRPCQKVDFKEGKESITHYYIIRVREGYTYIRLHPVTGRTHQLRVHCAHRNGLGLPIVGDSLYGTPSEQMMLRCVNMSFKHPFTGEAVHAKVPSFNCIRKLLQEK